MKNIKNKFLLWLFIVYYNLLVTGCNIFIRIIDSGYNFTPKENKILEKIFSKAKSI